MKQAKNIQFLGIFAKNEKEAQQLLLGATKISLTKFLEKYQDEELNKMLENIEKYKFPPSMHVTSFFLGNNKQKQQSKYFTDFQENLEQNLIIHGLALSPQNIVTCILQKNFDIPIENEFAHMTTLLGKMKPKESKDILEEIFKELEYHKFGEEIVNDKIWKLERNAQTIYVIQFAQKIMIPGITKIH